MNRRTFNKVLSATLAAPPLSHKRVNASESHPVHSHDQIHSPVPAGPPQQITMLLYPTFIPLDLFGPHLEYQTQSDSHRGQSWYHAYTRI